MQAITSISQGWHAPGYRDPELHLKTLTGDIHVKLSAEAFTDLERIVEEVSRLAGEEPLDMDCYPYVYKGRPLP